MKLRLRINRLETTKILLLGIAAILSIFAIFTLSQQQRQSQKQVAAHTQTLNEIKNVVTQLEQNNQENHDTTIKYLECIVQGLITSSPQTAESSFQACLAVSGLQGVH